MSPIRNLLRATLASGLLLGVFYIVPVEVHPTRVEAWVRGFLALAAVSTVTWLVFRLAVRLRRGERGAGPATLAVALSGGVILFALVDYAIATVAPGEFHGLETRTDALYFAVTTLATVGYGDIHPTGQWARGLVAFQQAYNVLVIGTAATVLFSRLRETAPFRAGSGGAD